MEERAYPRCDQVWVASEAERDRIGRYVDPRRISVIPNAVPMPIERPQAPDIRAVAFLGWYQYPPNEAAALELIRSIMPVVRKAGGPSELVLVGSEPTAAIQEAAKRSEDVTVTGAVEDVIRICDWPAYWSCRCVRAVGLESRSWRRWRRACRSSRRR